MSQHQKSSSRISGASKKFQGEYRIFVSVLALIFVYSDAIFDRQNLIRLALSECEAPLYVIFVCGEFYAQVRDLPLPIPLIYANFDKQRLNFDNAFYIKHEHA